MYAKRPARRKDRRIVPRLCGLRRRLRLPAIENVRARRPRFVSANTTPPTTTRLRETAQARSVMVTVILDGAARASSGSASSPRRAAHSPSRAAPTIRRSIPLFSAVESGT
jgi:hypothetical protein